ncbi:MAG: ABC transporter ATP-binding protein [Gammaproteobacteria bacterium]
MSSPAGAAPAALTFSAVTKHYAGRPVLNNLNLMITARATALVGVNGAGKSTLLRASLDLIGIDAGSIAIDGLDHRSPQARANLAYLPERFLPPHYLNGRELLRALQRLHGGAYDEAAAVACCRALDFDPALLERRARDYSKGMTQKLGLAACLLARRSLLILDEPLSGLDPLARRYCCEQLAAEKMRGTGLLFSTHTLHGLEALCDWVVVMHAGRIIFDDTLPVLKALHPTGTADEALLELIAG